MNRHAMNNRFVKAYRPVKDPMNHSNDRMRECDPSSLRLAVSCAECAAMSDTESRDQFLAKIFLRVYRRRHSPARDGARVTQ